MVLHALILAFALARPAAEPADSIVRRGIAAIGGEDRWRAVKTLELIGRGVTYHIGDSEWFDGPYFIDQRAVDDWRDVVGTRRAVRTRSYQGIADTGSSVTRTIWTLATVVQAAGDSGDGPRFALAPDTLALLLAPEHLLYTALGAPDLRRENDTVFRFVRHHVVTFHVGRSPVRIFFEAENGFPRMVEVRRAFRQNVFWTAWGDVTQRIRYSDWSIERPGIWYPRQIDTELNGRPSESVSYGAVRVIAAPDGTFDLPPSDKAPSCGFGCIAADSVPLGTGGPGGLSMTSPLRGSHEIAPGIVQIVAGWNSTLVRQPDGVVVIEAPISAGYSRQVIAEAARQFPGLPVKGVITTTDFWWHVAGLREYVARGIPIYVLDRNVRVVTERARAPHTLLPDSLERAPRSPIIRPVSARMTLGTGDNCIELIPFHTEGLDRMVMVYLPNRHLVYTAEGIQLYPSGLAFPETAIEVVEAVKREGLTPERFIGMHVAVTPWTRLMSVLDSLGHQ
jgi:hypothetical protein